MTSERVAGSILFPFNDVVDLQDCRLRLDAHLFQDRHELCAERVELGRTLEHIYDLQALLVAIADMVLLSVGHELTDRRKSTDDLIVFGCGGPFNLKQRDYASSDFRRKWGVKLQVVEYGRCRWNRLADSGADRSYLDGRRRLHLMGDADPL